MLPENKKQNRNLNEFEFQKSLKERDPYPFLKFFRVERYVTRPLASLIVRAVFRTPVTPNQLTVVSCMLGVASGAAFLGGSHAYFILAGALFQLSSIVDCADGMLARSKDMCTRYGALLDLFCDRIVDFCVLTGIAFGQFRYSGDRFVLVLTLVCTGLYFLQVILYYLMRHYLKKDNIGQAAEARGLSIFILFLFALFNHLDLFVMLAFIELLVNLSSKIIRVIRWRHPENLSS